MEGRYRMPQMSHKEKGPGKEKGWRITRDAKNKKEK